VKKDVSFGKRLLLFPLRTLRLLPRTVLALLLLAGIALNIATLTVTSVFTVASGVLSGIGLTTVAARETAEAAMRREAMEKANREALERAARETAERRAAVRKIASSTRNEIRERIARQSARNTASVFGEAIPVVGIGVIAAALALEIKDSCDTARDMTALAAAVETEGDPELARAEAAEAFDCRELVPNANDLPSKDDILEKVRAAQGAAWAEASEQYAALADTDWSEAVAGIGDNLTAFGSWLRSWYSGEPVSE